MAFKMKGHTLPGINQRSEGDTDTPDGRSASSAFQKQSPLEHYTGPHKGAKKHPPHKLADVGEIITDAPKKLSKAAKDTWQAQKDLYKWARGILGGSKSKK